MGDEIVEMWKLVAHLDATTSVRVYEAKKCKSTYMVKALNQRLNFDKVMVPGTSLVDEMMSGNIWCRPDQFEEAAKLLEEWMVSRCENRIKLLTTQIEELQKYRANPPKFNKNQKVVRVDS